jgi:hypothetical protein
MSACQVVIVHPAPAPNTFHQRLHIRARSFANAIFPEIAQDSFVLREKPQDECDLKVFRATA